MNPALETLTSIYDTCFQVLISSFLLPAFEALRASWFEALVVAVALHFYFLLSKQTSFVAKPKTATGALKAGTRPGNIVTKATWKGQTATCSASTAKESQEARQLVIGIMANGGKCRPATLQQYEGLVRGRGLDLSEHLDGGSGAQALYIALIGCGVRQAQLEANARAEEVRSARSSTERLLADMRAFGFARDLSFYTMIMKIHIRCQFLHDTLWLHDIMVSEGIIPDAAMCMCLLNVCISCHENVKARALLGRLLCLGAASLRTCMATLRLHARARDWKAALQLLEDMQAAGLAPDNLIFNSVLGLCISASQVSEAERAFNKWENIVDVVSCNTLLKGYAHQGNLVNSEALLCKMVTKGPAPNIISFNTIMDCSVRTLQAGRPTGADGHRTSPNTQRFWGYLEQLLELGLHPDRYTCSTLVKGMHLTGCLASDIDRMIQLICSIGPEALQATGAGNSTGDETSNERLLEVLFNTLLNSCVTARYVQRMTEIFELMQAFDVSVSSVTMGTLIKAFGQAGELGGCREVWRRMEVLDIKPTVVTCGCYIDACIRAEDMAAAKEVFASMPARGLRPNTVIYTLLMRGFAAAKQPHEVLHLYDDMLERGVSGTAGTFNAVLDVLVRQLVQPQRVLPILDRMRISGAAPDSVTYAILLGGDQAFSAVDLMSRIHGADAAIDEAHFKSVLLACSQAGRVNEAEEVIEEMLRRGVPPTYAATSIVVKMYGKARMLSKAVAFSDKVEREYGLKPNLYVYTCLIRACVQNGQLPRGFDIFVQMLKSSVAPDAVTYGTLVHGCVGNGRLDLAVAVARHAWGLPRPDSACSLARALFAAPRTDARVELQREVVSMLASVLRRKDRGDLLAELEAMERAPRDCHFCDS